MKKMRKLIPAFAMLLVSAIMMSTASFAWFTMNDNVDVTGMQVQAKAAGNLLISEDKMTATSSGIVVDFEGAKKQLIPITFTPAATAGHDGAWADADGVAVDPIYGTTGVGAVLNPVTVTATPDDHFAEYVVYLATAGDTAITGTLMFDLEVVAGTLSEIAPAYTVALYVAADDETKANINWNQPAAVYNQLTNSTAAAGYTDTGVQVEVPSTYGKVADTKVGLMVVIRIYVDGALPIAGGVEVPDTKRITAVTDADTYNANTMANYTFYTDAEGTVVYDKSLLQEGQKLNTVVASYWDGTSMDQHENAPANYVNNTTVPAAGTAFSINFKINETTNP